VQRIWYVAYGSNLSRERFRTYLRGGQPDGSRRNYPGCRDTSDELDSFGLLITGGVYFAGRSSGWGAGMAFYDPEAPGEVAARAYLITAEQFVDVLAQETLRSPGMALDLAPAFRGDRYSNGVGGYPILVRVGCRRGVPLVTFPGGTDRALPGGDGNWPARGPRMVTQADRSLSVDAPRVQRRASPTWRQTLLITCDDLTGSVSLRRVINSWAPKVAATPRS
jgi:hypothetical protein